MGKIEGSINLNSKEMRIKVLTTIDIVSTTTTIWSSIINDGGMSEISFTRESDRGVKKEVNNFSTIGEGGGVILGDESIIMLFLLSFLGILKPRQALEERTRRVVHRVSIMVNLGFQKDSLEWDVNVM